MAKNKNEEYEEYIEMSPEAEKNWEERTSYPIKDHPIPEEIMDRLRAAGYVK